MIHKGVILAGGHAKRMYPATLVTNKHLLPIAGKPMIYYPIQTLIEAGIDEILVILGGNLKGEVLTITSAEESFKHVDFSYKVQVKAGGIAQALLLAKKFVGNEKFAVILGDNIFGSPITHFIEEFDKDKKAKASILLKEVPDPERYGIAELNKKGEVVSVEEKPEKPKSNLCVVGIYGYTPDVFNVCSTLKPSSRGELEISDVQQHYVKQKALIASMYDGHWTDAGTHYSYQRANLIALETEVRHKLLAELEELN